MTIISFFILGGISYLVYQLGVHMDMSYEHIKQFTQVLLIVHSALVIYCLHEWSRREM